MVAAMSFRPSPHARVIRLDDGRVLVESFLGSSVLDGEDADLVMAAWARLHPRTEHGRDSLFSEDDCRIGFEFLCEEGVVERGSPGPMTQLYPELPRERLAFAGRQGIGVIADAVEMKLAEEIIRDVGLVTAEPAAADFILFIGHRSEGDFLREAATRAVIARVP